MNSYNFQEFCSPTGDKGKGQDRVLEVRPLDFRPRKARKQKFQELKSSGICLAFFGFFWKVKTSTKRLFKTRTSSFLEKRRIDLLNQERNRTLSICSQKDLQMTPSFGCYERDGGWLILMMEGSFAQTLIDFSFAQRNQNSIV